MDINSAVLQSPLDKPLNKSLLRTGGGGFVRAQELQKLALILAQSLS